MGSNGQQIAAILPKGAKGPVHVKGLNQFNAEADWQGEPKFWGGSKAGRPGLEPSLKTGGLKVM